jgi:hypothetical protein
MLYRLDFLGSTLFAAKTLDSAYWISLDFLGFPWNLSSESRLFSALRGIFATIIFAAPCPALKPLGVMDEAGLGERAVLVMAQA